MKLYQMHIIGDPQSPINPEKEIPSKPNPNPDPTKPVPGKNDPGKNDPTRIKEPDKTDPTRIDEPTPPNKPQPSTSPLLKIKTGTWMA